jgi:hypothetical protein
MDDIQIPEGQLSDTERDYLFNLVISIKPNLVLESGTWLGGGSTLFLVKGVFENKIGKLHTYESHTPYWKHANNFSEQSIYKSYIDLFNEDFIEGCKKYNFEDNKVIIFLDGCDEGADGKHPFPLEMYPEISENLQAFKILEFKIKSGTNVLLHDWNVDLGRGTWVKKYLEKNNFNGWELVNIITTTTGLAHLIKK